MKNSLAPEQQHRRRRKSLFPLFFTSAAAYFLLFANDDHVDVFPSLGSRSIDTELIRFWGWWRNGIDAQYYRRLTEELPDRRNNVPRRIAQATLTEDQIRRLVRQNDHIEEENDVEEDEDRIRVLLYIATHLSQIHKDALELLWPILVQSRPLLYHADVLFYSSEELPANLLEGAFPNNQVLVQTYNNTGRQEGATQALQEALENDWFEGYDWVVRVNPDVIVRNDTWITNMMLDAEVQGIFADCSDGMLNGRVPIVQTDFFAVRPEHIVKPTDAIIEELAPETGTSPSAEKHATKAFEGIWSTGHAAILPDNRPNDWCCRISGEHSSVEHNHEWLMLLLDCLREAGDEEEETTTCLQRYIIPTEGTMKREERERSLRGGPIRELSPFVPRVKSHSSYYPSRKSCDWKA